LSSDTEIHMTSSLAATALIEPEIARVQVRPLLHFEEPLWEEFVARSAEATFFHKVGWRRAVAEGCGHEGYNLAAWRGARLVGILPLTHVRSRLFGDALVSVAFGVYGGILAEDKEVVCALGAAAVELGQRLDVGHVELRHERPLALGWTAKAGLYATFKRAISASHDENLKAIPRKKRADLRKAIGNPKLRVDAAADVRTFFRVYAESVRNLGTPVFPLSLFEAIQREFDDAVEISAVHGPEGAVAAVMSFYFKDQVLPYFGGATPFARPLHAYDRLYWELMRRAADRRCQIYDFGRSKRGTGAFDYKTYWGFEPTPLHYQYFPVRAAVIPDVNPLNPKYRLMAAAWKRLPLSVANVMGPHIARQLG
jgi:FemAB-related protein (PEP-CTERM system-associated)